MKISLLTCLSFFALGVSFSGTTVRAADEIKTTPQVTMVSTLPTLHIVGDSTLKSNAPLRGWGQEIGVYFDPTKINVINDAIGGRSSRTFQNEGRWDKVMAQLKPGDFVLIQFGHNDDGDYLNPAAKGRPSIHGEDETTAEVTKADGTKETIHTFGWYMRKYGTDAKSKGATAIFCSMVPHKDWVDGKIRRGQTNTFVKWTEDAAKASGAQYINLNEIVAQTYDKAGREKVETFFADARTHSSVLGAQNNAAAVISGLKSLQPDPLANYFSKDADAIAPATP